MKKKAVRLAVAAALLAVLTTAFFVIKNLTKEEEKQGPVTVSQTPVKDIEGITYRCEATKGEPISLVREKDIWYYEKDKEFPLDQVFVTNTMAVSAAEAVSKAERTIENPEEDLSQYGLDQPVLTVILKKITGDEVKLNVGSYNAGVEGYYLQVEGDQKLYLIDATMVFAFDVSVYDIADKEDYPYVEAGSFTHIAVQKGSKTGDVPPGFAPGELRRAFPSAAFGTDKTAVGKPAAANRQLLTVLRTGSGGASGSDFAGR